MNKRVKLVTPVRALPEDRANETQPVSEKELADLTRGVEEMQRVKARKRARMSAAERAADDAATAESLRKARASHDSWLKDPPWFVFFDPYASVLSGTAPRFLDSRGKPVGMRSGAGPSGRALLTLAKAAADEYLQGMHLSREEWTKAVASYKREVNHMVEAIPFDKLQFVDPLGNPLDAMPSPSELDAFSVASLYQQLVERNFQQLDRESLDDVMMLRTMWCVICLKEIDSALLSCIFDDAGEGIVSAFHARDALTNAQKLTQIVHSKVVEPGAQEAGSNGPLVVPTQVAMARRGAAAKLARDPKQAAKRQVKVIWDEWQAFQEPEKSERYKNKSRFAKDMLEKFEALESQPVIVGWCTEWERGDD